MDQTVSIAEAVGLARAYTQGEQSFAISFLSFDESTCRSEGRKEFGKVLLRKSNPKDKNRDHKLFFFDIETKENRMCWIPLILSINQISVVE